MCWNRELCGSSFTKWKQISYIIQLFHWKTYAASTATYSSTTFYTLLLIFVSLKYSVVRARKKKQLKSITKAGGPDIDWRTAETTGCRSGYRFFIPIQTSRDHRGQRCVQSRTVNRRGRSIRAHRPIGLANEPLFAYGGYPWLCRVEIPTTFHQIAKGFKFSRFQGLLLLVRELDGSRLRNIQ